MNRSKFSHVTRHLKGKQHQLDPNLDLKQLVHHATVQYVDRDADGDVDVYDNPKKKTPDENPKDINVGYGSKKLIRKQKGEVKHTKVGMAFEDLRKWFGKGDEGGVGGGGWDRYNTQGERIGKCAREPGEAKPKCLSKEKAAKMTKDQISAAVKRKRKEDPVADRPGKGGKPIMSSNKINENILEEKRYCMKCKKRESRNECSYGPEMWDKMTVKGFMESMKPEPDHEHSMIRSELETIRAAVNRLKKKMKGEGNVEAWVQSKITKAADYIDSAADYVESGEHNVHNSMDEEKGPCWVGYKQVGMKKKNGKMVPNCVPENTEYIMEKNAPTNPKLWAKWKAKAKAKFDVYPSAYANGWAAKGYKSDGGEWKSVNENLKEAVRISSKTGNIILVTLSWRGRYYMIKMFFPQISKPNRQEVQDQISKVYPGSRVQSYHISDIKPGEQFLQTESAAWTREEGKNKEGGLNEKGRKSYERENPGSDLKAPSKKVGNKRRASFCARMSGMKKKLTSAKTANDPNSRINKSLRAWNC